MNMDSLSEYSRRAARGPHEAIEEIETSLALEHLLKRALTVGQLVSVVGVFWLGLAQCDIGDSLGVTKSRIHQHVYKALKKFRHPRWMNRLRKALDTDRIQRVGFDSWIR